MGFSNGCVILVVSYLFILLGKILQGFSSSEEQDLTILYEAPTLIVLRDNIKKDCSRDLHILEHLYPSYSDCSLCPNSSIWKWNPFFHMDWKSLDVKNIFKSSTEI
ncbi:uncharacterized protein LOC144284159 [Canis aureus]